MKVKKISGKQRRAIKKHYKMENFSKNNKQMEREGGREKTSRKSFCINFTTSHLIWKEMSFLGEF